MTRDGVPFCYGVERIIYRIEPALYSQPIPRRHRKTPRKDSKHAIGIHNSAGFVD